MIAERHKKGRLRVALLTYRGNPHSGGQGVYVRELSKALVRLGHSVTVFSGQPYPSLRPGVELVKLPSLDLYRPEDPFRRSRPIRGVVDALEFGMMCLAGFPEPLTFSIRAWRRLASATEEFDVVHDNQSLGYGLLPIDRRIPVLATIHHPIVIDARLELEAASRRRRPALRRWYAFTRMQGRVARRLRQIVTVSEAARDGIEREMGVPRARIAVVPNGVDADFFRPQPERARVRGRIVATASADMPLKGLRPLLEAFARLRSDRRVELVVIGKPKLNGSTIPGLVSQLGISDAVRFVNGIDAPELVRLYAEAEVAVVPSLYEGFSLPAVEAMACAVPLVTTTGGALPEVVGPDGEAALLVPPGNPSALASAIGRILDDRALAARLGCQGRTRVLEHFSWDRAAMLTVDRYRQLTESC